MSPDLSPERPRTRLLVPGLILVALVSLLAVVGFVVFSGDSPEDTTQIDLVRQHLQAEATRFGQRDFSDAAIHGRGMPGSQALTQSAGRIDIVYNERPAGATITFSTDDPGMRSAPADWVMAQDTDHGTGPHHG